MDTIDHDLFTLHMLGDDDVERRIFLELQKNEMSSYNLIAKTKFPQTSIYRKLGYLQKYDLVFPVRKRRISHETFYDVLYSRIQIDIKNGIIEITYTPK